MLDAACLCLTLVYMLLLSVASCTAVLLVFTLLLLSCVFSPFGLAGSLPSLLSWFMVRHNIVWCVGSRGKETQNEDLPESAFCQYRYWKRIQFQLKHPKKNVPLIYMKNDTNNLIVHCTINDPIKWNGSVMFDKASSTRACMCTQMFVYDLQSFIQSIHKNKAKQNICIYTCDCMYSQQIAICRVSKEEEITSQIFSTYDWHWVALDATNVCTTISRHSKHKVPMKSKIQSGGLYTIVLYKQQLKSK